MKTFLSPFCRVVGLSALAIGMSSCSLFQQGKYASKWEIESDVPASLNSGEASVPAPVTGRTVQSNLSGPDQLAMAEGSQLDLPMTENGGLVEVPKPEWAMTTGQPGQSPVELLSVPSQGQSTDLPTATYTNADLTNLLPAPPPSVTEEEVVLTPGALVPAAPVIPSGNLPLPGSEAVESAGGPVKTAAAPTIPLLYGKLDLGPYLNPALFVPNPAPTTASVQ